MLKKSDSIFWKNTELCAAEVINRFEPNILKTVDLYDSLYEVIDFEKLDLLNRKQTILQLRKEIRKTLETTRIKAKVSTEYLIDNGTLHFAVIKYYYRLSIKDNDFFDSVCKELLNNIIFNIKSENSNFYNSEYYQIVLKNAAINLLSDFSGACLIYNENTSMFSYINELASLTYEKCKTNGMIYFLFDDDIVKFNDYVFKFNKKLKFNRNNLKLIRKYLQLTDSNEKIGLISDTEYIYGLAIVDDTINYFTIIFKNGYTWELYQNLKKLFIIKNNRLIIENKNILIKDFEMVYQQVFSESYKKENMCNIEECIQSLVSEDKGTVLVISDKSEDFIQRYEKVSTTIVPTELDSENIKKLSSIDGAIIIDERSCCFGFGAILDGIDKGAGDPARGSRYNSTQRFYDYYIEYYKNINEDLHLMVFILSDDGNYNIFPDKEDWNDKILKFICENKKCSLVDLFSKFKSLPPSKLSSYLENNIAIGFIHEYTENEMTYYEPISY